MEEKLICKICLKHCKGYIGLGVHLTYIHNISKKEYYDIYLKKDKEDTCIICGNNTRFISINKGYKNICSKQQCNVIKGKKTKLERYNNQNYNNREKYKETCLEKYGVDNVRKDPEIINNMINSKLLNIDENGLSSIDRQKINNKKTCLEKYGYEYILQVPQIREDIKQTCNEKYGGNAPTCSKEVITLRDKNYFEKTGYTHPVFNPEVIEKKKSTCLEEYGVEYQISSDKTKNKIKISNIEKLGVDNLFKYEPFKNALKEFYFNKYGVFYPFQSNIIQEKCRNTLFKRYGVYYTYQLSRDKCYSQVSQELFWKIYEQLPEELQKECYFAELNKERFLKFNKNIFFYDFCILSKRIFIEFQGDYWHRNPKFYEATEENIKIWEKDKFKKEVAEDQGFKLFYIWESDYQKNKKEIINNIICSL